MMIDVKRVAKLARLQLEPEEEVLFQKQIDMVVEYFSELKEIPTEGIEPLVTPLDSEAHLRVDEVNAWEDSSLALENAPESSGNLFKVPPVV